MQDNILARLDIHFNILLRMQFPDDAFRLLEVTLSQVQGLQADWTPSSQQEQARPLLLHRNANVGAIPIHRPLLVHQAFVQVATAKIVGG